MLPPQVKAPSGEGQETTANPSTSPATTAATQNPPPPPPPPPSIASAVIDQSKIDGSRSLEEGAPSPNARETEIGAYKAQLYRAIGSAWYISVDRNLSLLAVGEVKIRFFVRANGVIDNIQVTDRSGTTTVLEGISLKAIDKIQPFNVFSSSMKQQVGDGYWDEISFSIY